MSIAIFGKCDGTPIKVVIDYDRYEVYGRTEVDGTISAMFNGGGGPLDATETRIVDRLRERGYEFAEYPRKWGCSVRLGKDDLSKEVRELFA